ncbi:hypothetical protein LNAOJCKE_1733 [Methylorubrum aminovorans]|uniref:Lipopolysaccharide biosynthesis protein n=2 Tax=Methylorubrum aminovorans TaxID=269069 RepID=A0ABQ4UCG3_9HYPH|nr:GumC family protein [Methylorubrum aminovorans]GJE64527.1 hypothetical protein LNAOJCKE_1733 [Methylorubrum aminovorans]
MFRFESHAPAEPVRIALAGGSKLASGTTGRGFDTIALLGVLWRSAGFIALGGLACLALAVASLGIMRPIYTAGIQILLDPSDLRVLENEVTTRTPQADSGVSLAESQARVIQSGTVLRRVVEQLRLDQDPDFAKPNSTNPIVVAVKGLLGLTPSASANDPVNVAIDSLSSVLSVRRPERTFVLEVAAKASDPQLAANIANAVGSAYLAEESAARTEAAKRVSDALTARLEALRRGVEAADRRVVKYRQDNRLMVASGRLLTDQQLGDLNRQLVTASIRAVEARERLAQAERMRARETGTALPEMLQSPEMQALRQQYAAISRSKAETATRLGERHPAIVELNAQLREAEQRIEAEKRRIVDSTRKDAERAVGSEAAIRRQLAQAKSEMVTNESAVVDLSELEREREALRTLYESVLRRSREASEQERLNTLNVRIISEAVAPRQRTWPPGPRIVLPAALLLGMIASAGIALLRYLARDREPAQPRATVRTGTARELVRSPEA